MRELTTTPPHRFGSANGRLKGVTRAVLLFLGIRLLVLAVFLCTALKIGRSPWAVLTQWDSQWYRRIAESGYGHTVVHADGRLLSDYAFFPLMPLLERAVAAVLQVPVLAAGVGISVAASLVAAAGIYAWGEQLFGHRVAVVSVAVWAVLPMAPVLWMPYSESLFTALAVWSLYAVHHRSPVTAGALAALAGLCRPTGVAVAAAVVVVLALDVRRGAAAGVPRGWRDLWRPVLGAVLAPLGTLGYLVYVASREDHVLGYARVTNGWGNGVDGGRAFVAWALDRVQAAPHWPGVLVLAGVAVLVGLIVACIRQRQPLGLLLFTIGLVALAFLTSGYFGSKPRYLLPAFPLVFPVAAAVTNRVSPRVQKLLLAAGMLCTAAYGAAWLLGPGPP